MASRKEQLKSMFGLDGAEAAPETKAQPTPKATAPRAASGAVKAMGLSLDALSSKAGEAEALREALAAEGDRIVALDANKIDPAPLADRLDVGSDDFEALKTSMAQEGQQVPILVRPHPEPAKAAQGWYQAAYGHRRLKAAQMLGIAVKAQVRMLDDAALLIAQGKENAERRDLSFIEKALFAKAMMDAGFERAVAQAALSVHKAEMTRFLQVAEAVPVDLVALIGPAPKVGRPRWQALGDLLAKPSAREAAVKMASKETFKAADSDQRFQLVFDQLSKKPAKTKTETRDFADGAGRTVAKLSTDAHKSKAVVTIDMAAAPGLAEALADALDGLAKTHGANPDNNKDHA